MLRGNQVRSLPRTSPQPLALGTFWVGIVVWYLGGAIGAANQGLDHPFAVALNVGVFLLFVCLSYPFSNGIGWNGKEKFDKFFAISHFRVLSSMVALFVLFLIGQYVGGMAAYHSGRMIAVIGIVGGMMGFSGRGKYRLIYIGVFFSTLAMALTFYSRRPFLTILIVPVLMYVLHSRTKRLTIPAALVMAAVSFLGLIFITGLRGFEWSGDLSEVPIIFGNGLTALGAGQGMDTLVLLDFAISVYPDYAPFLLGLSVLAVVVNPLPRVFWEDKPISFGIELAALYFGISPESVPTNFGPGIVTEAYANGGIFMVALWGVATGSILAYVDRKVQSRKLDWFGVLVAVVVLPGIFFLVRGDLLNASYEVGIKLIPAYLVFRFAAVPTVPRRPRLGV